MLFSKKHAAGPATTLQNALARENGLMAQPFSALLEACPDPCCIKDHRHHLLYSNPAYTDQLSAPLAASAIEMKRTRRRLTQCESAVLAAAPASRALEVEIRHEDSAPDRFAVTLFSGGDPAAKEGWVCSYFHRIEAPTVATKIGRHYQGLSIPTYIWECSENDLLRLVDFNEAGRKITEGGIEAFRGKRFEEVMPGHDQIAAMILRAHREQSALSEEMIYRFQSTGESRALAVSYVYAPPNYVVVHTEDISEYKAVQAALRRKEQILEAVASVATFFLGEGGWREKAPAALEKLGRATEVSRSYLFENHYNQAGDLCSSQRVEWVAPGVLSQRDNPDLQSFSYDAGGFSRWRRHLAAGKALYGLATEFPEAEQTLLQAQDILSLAVFPIMVHQQCWGFIGFDDCSTARRWSPAERDALQAAAGAIGGVIEREEAQRQLADQQARMVHASHLASLGSMASGVAHEVNNPLAVISIGAQQLPHFIGQHTENAERLRETAAKIQRNVERIQHIVHGLRRLSRDTREERLEFVALPDMLEAAFELCRERFRTHAIRFDTEAIETFSLECRPVLITQAVLNLLGNAYDAVQKSGEKGRPKRIFVRAWQEEKAAFIAVADSGPGVPKDIHQKIFDPFFTTKAVGEGTGLGLSIAKNNVEKHGGSILLIQQPSETVFLIRLPQRQRTEEEKA